MLSGVSQDTFFCFICNIGLITTFRRRIENQKLKREKLSHFCLVFSQIILSFPFLCNYYYYFLYACMFYLHGDKFMKFMKRNYLLIVFFPSSYCVFPFALIATGSGPVHSYAIQNVEGGFSVPLDLPSHINDGKCTQNVDFVQPTITKMDGKYD